MIQNLYSLKKYNLEYNRVIDRTQKDLVTYQTKFKVWDRVVSEGKAGIPEISLPLLADPTIYIYAMLNFTNYWYQDMIISDDYRFKIFCAANQMGKSKLLNVQAIRGLLLDHGSQFNRAIISASLPQAKFQMQRIRDMLRQSKLEWEEDKGDVDNIMILSMKMYHPKDGQYFSYPKEKRYKYTNYLIIAPCTDAGALGYDLHALDLDEFDFWERDTKQFFYQIAQPRTFHTRGSISIYSNPNGREGFMYELWNQKLNDGTYKWHRYQFNYWDKDKSTQKEFDELTVGMTRRQIESTLLAEFSSSETSFFTYDEIKRSEDVSLNEYNAIGKQTYWFLDSAAVVDASVLVGAYTEPDEVNPQVLRVYMFKIHEYPIGYPLYRVAGVNNEKAVDDGWHYEKSVKEYLTESAAEGGSPVFGYDTQNNKGLIPLFESIGIYSSIEMPFSGPAKVGYYQKLKYYLEKGLLKRVVCKNFDYQMSVIEAKKTINNRWSFHHAKESDHDDIPDSD